MFEYIFAEGDRVLFVPAGIAYKAGLHVDRQSGIESIFTMLDEGYGGLKEGRISNVRAGACDADCISYIVDYDDGTFETYEFGANLLLL